MLNGFSIPFMSYPSFSLISDPLFDSPLLFLLDLVYSSNFIGGGESGSTKGLCYCNPTLCQSVDEHPSQIFLVDCFLDLIFLACLQASKQINNNQLIFIGFNISTFKNYLFQIIHQMQYKTIFQKLNIEKMHRPGIEPGSTAWKAIILPLNHRCSLLASIFPSLKPSSLIFRNSIICLEPSIQLFNVHKLDNTDLLYFNKFLYKNIVALASFFRQKTIALKSNSIDMSRKQWNFILMNKQKMENLKKLKIQDYQIGRTVGRGGFGKVKVAKYKKNGKLYALKMLKKAEIIKGQQIDHVYNENLVHSQLSHPFITNFKGLAQDSSYLYLVMELIHGGQLFSYLRSSDCFPTSQCKFYSASVTLIFQYLHNRNIVYRDLKPQNILIGIDGFLKLTDFGFAKILTEGRTFTICGTPQYIAPEVILNQGHGKAVDWWTLGVLIYQMHAGIDPFNDQDPMGIYKNILRGKISFSSVFEKEAKNAKSLIKHLLVADLSKRYGNLKEGVNDIKKHRWFDGFEWEDLLKKKLKPPYIPTVKSLGDLSNFEEYTDSDSYVQEVKSTLDPFLDW